VQIERKTKFLFEFFRNAAYLRHFFVSELQIIWKKSKAGYFAICILMKQALEDAISSSACQY